MIRALAALAWLIPSLSLAAGSTRTGTIRTGQSNAPATTLTISSFNVPSDAAEAALVVCVAATDGDASAGTWNSTSLLLSATETNVADSDIGSMPNNVQLWSLSRPALNTTSDLSFTVDSGANAIAVAFVIEGVADASPEATDSQSAVDSTSIVGSITTATADAFLVDCMSTMNISSDPSVSTNQSGQTERQEFAHSSQNVPVLGVSDKQGPASPGSTDMGWADLDFDFNGNSVQVLGSFAIPAVAGTAVKDMVAPGIIHGPR